MAESAERLLAGDLKQVCLVDDELSRKRFETLHRLHPETSGSLQARVLRAIAASAGRRAVLADETRQAFAREVAERLEDEWADIEARGDSYARDAIAVAAYAEPERCAALIESCPKGWKTQLKKALRKPV